jgi:starch-binding outer membrane protein, SusD/RagB family
MKKYIKSLCLVSMLVLAGSCEKELERYPYNALETSAAFETLTDFTNAARGMYQSTVASGNYFGGDWILAADALADNALTCSAGRQTYLNFHNWRYNAAATTAIYFEGFRTIRRANAILENVSKLPAGADKNNLTGEALAMRAMVHFDMVRIFGKGYTQAADADLGVPYVTSSDPDALPARESVKSNYDKIVADLIDAEKNIALSNGAGRINKSTVQGLLARAYLYRGDWQKCVDAATLSLTLNGNVGAIANFPRIWKDETTEGVLFKVLILEKDNVSVGVNYSQTAAATGTRSEYVVAFDLYNLYKATDVRKAAYFATSKFSAVDYNHIAKHFGRATGRANVVDVKVLRVAEVLLSRAEAYARLNKETEALKDLNDFRKQRYSDYAAGTETGANLLAAILLERRLELAFEGHRFFDLKRLGLGVTRATTGDRADGTGSNTALKSLPAGDTRFELPLPQQEILTNTKIVQNPGY